MTISSWPYVAQDVTDIEYGRLYSEMAATEGVVDSYGGNKLQVFADSSGMQVKVRAGSALLRGYMFHSTAEEIVPVSAAATQQRTDLVILELNLSEPNVADRIRLRVLPGTAGSSTPPNLTQTETGIYQIALGTVTVPPSATTIAADNVADVRRFTGHKTGQWTTATRPASPRRYMLGYNITLSRWEFWTGSTWADLGAVNLAAANVTGVLPLTKGGTGQTTALAALNALGIYPQVSQPAYADGRVWIKIPA